MSPLARQYQFTRRARIGDKKGNLNMWSWVEDRVLDESQYEMRKRKYGRFVYLFKFSLINDSYDSVQGLVFGYLIPLFLVACLIAYHSVCYLLTVTSAYKIGRIDVALASVHSISLAVFVSSTLATYFVYERGIFDIEQLYKERLYNYKHDLPPPEPTFFEKVVDFFIENGIVLGVLSLFTGVYIVSPLMDLRFWQESLRNFERRTEMEYFVRTGRKVGGNGLMHRNKEYAESAKFCLYENVKHHQNILSYFNKTNSILALPSFLAYMTGTITMGIAMVKILTLEGDSTIGVQFAYVIVLSSEILFMVMISAVGEYITSMAEEVFTYVSQMRIDLYDTEFRRDLLIFMSGTINPIALSSSKFNKCNHEALGNVFNAAYSCYNVTKASSMN
ncbi:Hypothetical protein NTJ_02805 [Nesidiocoris tenuis]|uniref:Odorant receptor n=1 Tax=Nesidiocoris tenuis TaxID=355587 RepID=A0ABN7ACH1_9HEMI|nr:Hypothetical protein NTJ_02805 [Nesidiocoris tenuis]